MTSLSKLLPEKDKVSQILLLTFFAGLFFNLLSISLAQIFYGLSFCLWLWLLRRRQRRFEVPSFFWPLTLYALLSFLASLLSVNPAISLRDSRELLIYFLIPISFAVFQSPQSADLVHYPLLISGAINLGYSLIIYFGGWQQGPRLKGFMGHYMTEAGLLMLFIIIGVAQTLFGQGKKRFLWAGLAAGSFFLLLLTLTRNAWLGLGVACVLLIGLWRPAALILVPFLFAAVFWLSPFPVKQRVLNTLNLYSPSNRERIEYLRAGLRIIGDFPLHGCGPDTVELVFQNPKYGLSAEAKLNVHLHNNLLQIAAERGLPSLIVWLIFMVWSFWGLIKKWPGKPAGALPWIAAAAAAVLALFTAGLFEYNFGDSEVVMFYLVLVTLPFAPAWAKKKETA